MDNKDIGQSCNCGKKMTFYQMNNKPVKVILDPGHGGEDIGENVNDALEKDANLEYALRVGDLLKQQGYEVLYTRETDTLLSEEEKKQLADSSGADLYVSLHRTSNISHMEQPGVEAIVIEPNETEMAAAKNMTKEIENRGFINLGVIRARGYSAEISNYEIPQVVLLTGIYRNSDNELDYAINVDDIIDATAKGITDTFKVQAQSNERDHRFKVQISRFRSYDDAQQLQLFLIQKGYKTNVVKVNEYYCVQCGDYDNLDKAAEVEHYFKAERYPAMILWK